MKMEKVCDDYSPNSRICNNSIEGKCSIATVMVEVNCNLMFRCPRNPWIDGNCHYVKHVRKPAKEEPCQPKEEQKVV